MEFQRLSRTEWQWQDNHGRQHGVRWFEAQHSLIWSAWADRPDGPQFQDAIRQTAADFLERGAPVSLTPPAQLLDDLREALDTSGSAGKKRGPFSWLRR
jgi:hypothetical protein